MRYLPLTPENRRAMLAKIGAPNIDALFRDVPREAVVPLSIFDLPDTQGELEVERALSKLAAKNVAAGSVPFFCGTVRVEHRANRGAHAGDPHDAEPGKPVHSEQPQRSAAQQP